LYYAKLLWYTFGKNRNKTGKEKEEMNKKKFETKEEYIKYCKEYEVLNIPSKYGSLNTYFLCGIERNTYFDNGRYISYEPKSYPCILVWAENDNSIDGVFIYSNDFV
jgi:hypothetical protein